MFKHKEKMKKIKWIILAVVALFIAGSITGCGIIIYESEYRIRDVDTAVSEDGKYTVYLQTVGEPEFPFGATHVRLVLKSDGKTIIKQSFDVANDGAWIDSNSWTVSWEEDCVKVVVSGCEQEDASYTLPFSGKYSM